MKNTIITIMVLCCLVLTGNSEEKEKKKDVSDDKAPVKKLYEGKAIKALLVTGGNAHDYKKQAVIVPEVLQERCNIEVDVIGPDIKTVNEKLAVKGWADGYDIVIYNICDPNQKNKEYISNVCNVHLKDSKPAVIIHGCLHSMHWKVGRKREKFEGEEWLKVVGVVSARHGHGEAISVKCVKEDHPVMKGLPKEWKTPAGELYNSNEVLPTVTTLAMGSNSNAKQGEQVCIWVNEVGGAKIFGTSIGHHNETIKSKDYGDMLARGLLWACGKLDAESSED